MEIKEKFEIINVDDESIEVKDGDEFDYTRDFHKVSLVIPISENGKLILCKRAKDKEPYPDKWVCAVGGKVSSGESFEDAAKRELLEETNLRSELTERGSFIYHKEDYTAKFYLFTTKEHISFSSLVPNKREVQFFKEFDELEVEKMIQEDEEAFAPTFVEAFKIFKN